MRMPAVDGCGGSETELVLASASPRRRDLLREAGYRFRTAVADWDDAEAEAAAEVETAENLVERLAVHKARAAIEAHDLRAELVLGADTAVELEGDLLGKPADEADARRILGRLSGTKHRVLTGLALVDAGSETEWVGHAATVVRMRTMAEAEIDAYVTSGEAMGKAGAYAIQETGDRYVDGIEGSFTNVVGLPMELLERMLRTAGHDPAAFRQA